jgi:hypothetical protein
LTATAPIGGHHPKLYYPDQLPACVNPTTAGK